MLQCGILFVLIYSHISVILSKDDPCNSFLEINDTTMSVAYTVSDNDPISCKKLKPFLWYRYIGSDKGYLTNVCPNKGQCGSRSQIWFKGTVPSVDDGETLARVCISKDGSCCNLHSRLKIKNCTDFIVYFVIPTSPCTHYCFESPASDEDVQQESDGGKIEFWVWITVSIGSVLFLFIVFLIRRKYKSKRKNVLHAEENENRIQYQYHSDPQIHRNVFNTSAFHNQGVESTE